MSRAAGRKRKHPNWVDTEYPAAKRAPNPGMYNPVTSQNKTSQYPMYKYVSPIAKKLLPGPNVKKTEYHAVVNYPQIYPNTAYFGGPDPAGNDVAFAECKGSVYPHFFQNMRAQCLTMCAQGNSSTDRTGNAVDAKGIQLYVTIKPPALHHSADNGDLTYMQPGRFRPTGGNNELGDYMGETPSALAPVQGAQARIVVILDKDFTGGKPPTVKDVFTDGCCVSGKVGSNYNNVYTTSSQIKSDATQRFLTIMNKIVPISSIGQVKTIKKNIKLDGLEIRYTNSNGAASPTNCAQNTIWMFILPDWQTPDANDAIPDDVINWMPVYTFTSRFRFLPK